MGGGRKGPFAGVAGSQAGLGSGPGLVTLDRRPDPCFPQLQNGDKNYFPLSYKRGGQRGEEEPG